MNNKMEFLLTESLSLSLSDIDIVSRLSFANSLIYRPMSDVDSSPNVFYLLPIDKQGKAADWLDKQGKEKSQIRGNESREGERCGREIDRKKKKWSDRRKKYEL